SPSTRIWPVPWPRCQARPRVPVRRVQTERAASRSCRHHGFPAPAARVVKRPVRRCATRGNGRVDEQVVGPDLVLTVAREGGGVVLALRGELDAYSAPGLDEHVARLLEDKVGTIVLDLSETAFLDSSGLRAILTAQRRLADAGGELR